MTTLTIITGVLALGLWGLGLFLWVKAKKSQKSRLGQVVIKCDSNLAVDIQQVLRHEGFKMEVEEHLLENTVEITVEATPEQDVQIKTILSKLFFRKAHLEN